MNVKKWIPILLSVAVAAVVVAVWVSRGRNAPESPSDVFSGKKEITSSSRISRRHRRNTQENAPANARENRSAKTLENAPKREYKKGGSGDRGSDKRRAKHLTLAMLEQQFKPEDRPIVMAVESALDREDYQAMREALVNVSESKSTAVRKHAIESLSWFGAQALPELTGFMSDEDSEVAEDALEASEQALLDMKDANQQFITAAQLLQTYANNEDAVSAFSGILTTAGSEIVMADEEQSAADGREKVVGVMSELINLGGQVAKEAKDAYSFITGNDWINVDEAVQWAADPDNYEAPDIE